MPGPWRLVAQDFITTVIRQRNDEQSREVSARSRLVAAIACAVGVMVPQVVLSAGSAARPWEASPAGLQESRNRSAAVESAEDATPASGPTGTSPGVEPPQASSDAGVDEAEARAERVLQFSQQHHPQLARLLRQLRKAESVEFDRAVRQLSGQLDRLERFRERAPSRYEAELAAWKTDWQIRLLVVRWSMSQDPELEREIRELLRDRQLVRQEQLRQEHERVAQRLKQLTEQLEQLERTPDRLIDEEFQRLTRRASAARESRAGRRSPADGQARRRARDESPAEKPGEKPVENAENTEKSKDPQELPGSGRTRPPRP